MQIDVIRVLCDGVDCVLGMMVVYSLAQYIDNLFVCVVFIVRMVYVFESKFYSRI